MHACRGGSAPALLAAARRSAGRALTRGTPPARAAATSCCHRKWQNTAVDASAAASAGLGGAASASGNLSAFPWREAPAAVSGLSKLVRGFSAELGLVGKLRGAEATPSYISSELASGGKAAFCACAAAIFRTKQPLQAIGGAEDSGSGGGGGSRHRRSAPPDGNKSAAAGGGAGPATEAEGGQSAQAGAESSSGVAPAESGGGSAAAGAAARADGDAEKAPGASAADAGGADVEFDLRAVMEEKLADFYAAAAAQAALSGLAPCYVLHDVMSADVVGAGIEKGAARGDPHDPRAAPGELAQMWQSMAALARRSATLTEAEAQAVIEEDIKRILRRDMIQTVHVDVQVLCRETFFVRETATDAIVQGSDAIATRAHHIRLETTQRRLGSIKDATLKSMLHDSGWSDLDWQVIDIDGWLGGNPLFASPPGGEP